MFPTEPVPERIGAYRVVKRMQAKGRTDVYVAEKEGPLGFSRPVQLKIVPFSIEDDARLAEELEREATICSRLNHPSVLHVLDFFEYERRLVLVLELVGGASLDRLVAHLSRRKQKLSESAVLYIGTQIASALAHAHGAVDDDGNPTPVLHRNLHPENVTISWDGEVRITGFGLGKIVGRTPDTVVGTVKGTPGFMAPEQARGERATPRSDVYGFAVLMWSLLTGQSPPTDGSRLTPLHELRNDVAREVAAAVEAALEPNPDKRSITAAELEQWLGKAIRSEKAREELREKALRLRSTRSPVGETQDAARTARLKTGPQQRRRLHLRGVRASMRPAGPGPLSQPAAPSARPSIRGSSMAPAPTSERAVPDMAAPRVPSFQEPIDVETGDYIPPDENRAGSVRPHQASSPELPPPPVRPPPTPAQGDPGDGAPPSSAGASWHPLTGNLPASSDGRVRQLTIKPPAAAQGEELALEPLPPIDAPRSRRRPLSSLESVGIASLTAALVVCIGILLVERDRFFGADEETAEADAGTKNDTSSAASSQATTRSSEAKRPPPPPPPPTEASASAEPAEDPLAEPPPPDLATLLPGEGYLTVLSKSEADVYINGGKEGAVNEPLVVPCGRWFLRLAEPRPGRYPNWYGDGVTVLIPCGEETRMRAPFD